MGTRTLAYIRVSTEKQVNEGVSLDAQASKVQAYAPLYELDLVDTIVDAGQSAKTMDRPGLQKALSMLKAGQAEALLIVKLDRLTRSVKDLGSIVESCTREGWALMSIGESIDTRSAAGRLVLNVLASVAQWEREAIGERTSAALQHKKAHKEKIGGALPFGWQMAADGIHLEPNSTEQNIMSEASKLQAQGLSLRKIGAALVARGYLPRNQSNEWNPRAVKDLLQAEAA